MLTVPQSQICSDLCFLLCPRRYDLDCKSDNLSKHVSVALHLGCAAIRHAFTQACTFLPVHNLAELKWSHTELTDHIGLFPASSDPLILEVRPFFFLFLFAVPPYFHHLQAAPSFTFSSEGPSSNGSCSLHFLQAPALEVEFPG